MGLARFAPETRNLEIEPVIDLIDLQISPEKPVFSKKTGFSGERRELMTDHFPQENATHVD